MSAVGRKIQLRGLSSVMRVAASSEEGAFWLALSYPHLARPRRLCQPPWTHSTSKEPPPPRRRNHLRKTSPLKRQPLFGRGPGGGASLREAASPGVLPLPRNPSQIHSRVDFPDVAAFDGADLPARLHQGRNGNNAFENAADTLAGVAAGHIVWIGRDDD